MSVGSH